MTRRRLPGGWIVGALDRGWLTLDGSPIGRALGASPWRRRVAGGVGLAAVAADLGLVRAGHVTGASGRALPPLTAIVAYLVLCQGDRASLGLRVRPEGGWRAWAKAVGVIGVGFGAFLVTSTALLAAVGLRIPLPAIAPEWLGATFVAMVLRYPPLEEATYRLAFVPGCVAALGAWPTVALGGVLFAALHVLYGNLAPDNLVAGLVLTWAFVKSGSISIPLLLHALGNLIAFAAQAANGIWGLGPLD